MRICREIQTWITDTITRPVETWVNAEETRCRVEPCNWWCLCCNKWFCWIVVILVKVILWVTETVTRLVTEVVCTIVGFILDLGALFINLILSIPILGGILRTLINWLTEIFWRIVGLPDFLLSLAGVRMRKKMYVKVIILNNNGVPHTDEATVMRGINTFRDLYNTACNINVIYTGVCVPQLVTPNDANNLECGAGGFFSDWWIGGSYYELVSADCAFEDGWKRVAGYGAETIVFVIQGITPASTVGCSFSGTHNYVVIEPNAAGIQSIAHEVSHNCLLPHIDGDNTNLMFPNIILDPAGELVNRGLSNFQIASIRGSRHVTFL
jgi:hypothetical protein